MQNTQPCYIICTSILPKSYGSNQSDITFRIPRVLFHRKSYHSAHLPSSPVSAISFSKYVIVLTSTGSGRSSWGRGSSCCTRCKAVWFQNGDGNWKRNKHWNSVSHLCATLMARHFLAFFTTYTCQHPLSIDRIFQNFISSQDQIFIIGWLLLLRKREQAIRAIQCNKGKLQSFGK